MEQEKSSLPPLEEIIEQASMKIVTIKISAFPSELWETNVYKQAGGGRRVPLVARVYEVDDRAVEVQGYLPSKIWYDDGLYGLFYVNETLPKAARPFKGKLYVMYTYIDPNVVLDYDANIRVLIDQVLMQDGKMAHLFVFGEEQATSLLVEKRKQ